MSDLFADALRQQQAGRPDDAARICRELVALDPRHAHAWQLLAACAHLRDRLDHADAMLIRALALDPEDARFFNNRGLVLTQSGQIDVAIGCFRRSLCAQPGYAEAHFNLAIALERRGGGTVAYARALACRPSYAEAHGNLGMMLAAAGNLPAALASFQRALALAPGYPEACNSIGNSFCGLGRYHEASAFLRRTLLLRPDHAAAHSNIGNVLRAQRHDTAASSSYRTAFILAPDRGEVHSNLGVVEAARGGFAAAIASFARALTVRPDSAEAHANLANVYQALGRTGRALESYRAALTIKPDYAEANSNKGIADAALGNRQQALISFSRAIILDPSNADTYCNLGTVHVEHGALDLAVAAFETALRLRPASPDIHSNLLQTLNYGAERTPAQLLDAHRGWNARHGRVADASPRRSRRFPRRLRVGYVSPDFRHHSVAYFLEPLLRHHDRAAIDVYCYADVVRPDAVTARFEALADHWRPVLGLSDAALEQEIRDDGIDILVDLAGHTAKNRLPVFAAKAAPIQVSWLGYPNTTGLDAMDYRFVDAITDPVGWADRWASETLLRLTDGFLCYEPPMGAPAPGPPPSIEAGYLTFGSFNNPAKLSSPTLDSWADLLIRIPGSRLILKGLPFADVETRAQFRARFGTRGVAGDRLTLVGRLPAMSDHLGLYNAIDIALDPFPYNGTTTTCEALWMGVPVVTLAGDRHAGRVGASLLHRMGLDDLVAADRDAYRAIAADLAKDPDRRTMLRQDLRPRMAASTLCDGPGFARKIEAAYAAMVAGVRCSGWSE